MFSWLRDFHWNFPNHAFNMYTFLVIFRKRWKYFFEQQRSLIYGVFFLSGDFLCSPVAHACTWINTFSPQEQSCWSYPSSLDCWVVNRNRSVLFLQILTRLAIKPPRIACRAGQNAGLVLLPNFLLSLVFPQRAQSGVSVQNHLSPGWRQKSDFRIYKPSIMNLEDSPSPPPPPHSPTCKKKGQRSCLFAYPARVHWVNCAVRVGCWLIKRSFSV